MNHQLVATEIDGTTVLVEVRTGDDPEQDVTILRNRSFDGVVDSIKRITRQLADALEEVKPDKAALEFGVDVGIEAGQLTALLVKGSGSASVKITLEWERAR